VRPIASLLTLVTLVVLALVGRAQADMLPDPSSADAHCTMAEQCPDGVECPSGIRRDASAVQACTAAQTAKGLAYRCHRDGNYFGTSVYCRPEARGSWSPPPAGDAPSAASPEPAASGAAGTTPPPRGGCTRCAIAPGSGSSGLAAMVAGMLAVLLSRRRWRRA